MNKLLIAIILALLPFISFFLQKMFCISAFDKKSFSKFIPVKYLDLVFVPFNFILIYVVDFNYWVFAMFFVVVIVSIILNFFWNKAHKEEKNPIYLYDSKKSRMSSAGWVHAVYAIIQAMLVLWFLVFSLPGVLNYLALLCFLVYIVFIPFSSRRIHGKFIVADKIYFYGAFLVFLVKLIYMII